MKFPPWWGYGYFLELHNEKTIAVRYKLLYISMVVQKGQNIKTRTLYIDIKFRTSMLRSV